MNIEGPDLMVIGYGLHAENDAHVHGDYSQFHQNPTVEVHIRRGTSLEAAAKALRDIAESLPVFDREYQQLYANRITAIREAAQKLAERYPHGMDKRDRGEVMRLFEELLRVRPGMDIPLGDEDGKELENLGL